MVPRLRLFGVALLMAVLAALGLVLLVVLIVGSVLVTVWIGLPILLAGVFVLRQLAGVHRRLHEMLLDETIPSPYLQPAGGNLFNRLRGLVRDPATWRDLIWLVVNSTAGLVISLVAVVEGLLDVVFWWLPTAVLLRTNALIGQALLSPSRKSELALRVQELTRSRAETVDTQAAEIRRIERDLHDGAQARLVSLGMTLGLAEELVASDPDRARQLIAEAQTSNRQALVELRDLVRGIHPPVLADRGLRGAAEALALTTPLPLDLVIDLPDRLPAPVESAAYFALAESVANVIKHSAATSGRIGIWLENGLLRMEIRDNGHGGARLEGGTGLRGVQQRLSAFDGKLALSSPSGGPTVVTMELPCVSSSPRILPSSGTG